LKKKIVALQLFAFTSYPIFLISGYSFPIESMPLGIRWIANLIPSTPYLTAFTRITQMGAGWHQILPELIHISLLLIFFFTLSLLRFKFLFHNQKTIDANIKTQ
jgi:ABC-2 type transport system permease protein